MAQTSIRIRVPFHDVDSTGRMHFTAMLRLLMDSLLTFLVKRNKLIMYTNIGRRDLHLNDTYLRKKATVPWNVWVKTARPFSLTASVSPILVGTAVAAYDGSFHVVNFVVTLFHLYFYKIAPLFGTIIGKAFEEYHYLPNSLTTFPNPPALKAMMEEVGWRDVGFYRLSRGMVAVHVGRKEG